MNASESINADIRHGIVVIDAAALEQLVYGAVARAVKEAFASMPASCSAPAGLDGDELIGSREVARLLGVTERTLRRLEHDGDLPRAIRVSPKIVRWRRGAIMEWLRADAKPNAAPDTVMRHDRQKPAPRALMSGAQRRSVFDETREREAATRPTKS